VAIQSLEWIRSERRTCKRRSLHAGKECEREGSTHASTSPTIPIFSPQRSRMTNCLRGGGVESVPVSMMLLRSPKDSVEQQSRRSMSCGRFLVQRA
jgi:hypothetical protein